MYSFCSAAFYSRHDACEKGGIIINEKQKLFCDEYVKDFDAERAAHDAGYSRSSEGWRLLRREDIRSELKKSVAKPPGMIATHEEVLMFLTAVMSTDEQGNKINEERTVLNSIPQRVKLTDAMTAADKLHKYYMQKTTEDESAETGIVILPEIRN